MERKKTRYWDMIKIDYELFHITGGPDVNKAAKYILWRFNQTNRAKLNVYPQ